MQQLKTIMLVCLMAVCLAACQKELTSEDILARGYASFGQGNYQTALEDARLVLQSEQDNVTAHVLCGDAATHLQQFEAASECYQQARRLLGAAMAGGPSDAERGRLLVDLVSVETKIGAVDEGRIWTRDEILVRIREWAEEWEQSRY